MAKKTSTKSKATDEVEEIVDAAETTVQEDTETVEGKVADTADENDETPNVLTVEEVAEELKENIKEEADEIAEELTEAVETVNNITAEVDKVVASGDELAKKIQSSPENAEAIIKKEIEKAEKIQGKIKKIISNHKTPNFGGLWNGMGFDL